MTIIEETKLDNTIEINGITLTLLESNGFSCGRYSRTRPWNLNGDGAQDAAIASQLAIQFGTKVAWASTGIEGDLERVDFFLIKNLKVLEAPGFKDAFRITQ